MDICDVTLSQMLDARDRRVDIQNRLLRRYGSCVISFTMNIAGPVKNSPLILRAFHTGLRDLELSLRRCRVSILERYEINEVTGNEAFFAVDSPAVQIKRLCCELEDSDDMGRLYDMDVLEPSGASHNATSGDHALTSGNYASEGSGHALTDGDHASPDGHSSTLPFVKLDRRIIGLPERRCLICNAPGKDCASRRIHTVEELQHRTQQVIRDTLRRHDASRVAEYAVRSLLYEVCVTPKPGLVDRNNCGSHQDMDIYTFMSSSACLFPYFQECFLTGYDMADAKAPAQDTFARLRLSGKLAENRMLLATEGVNTHKGAIFTMGVLCGALGRLSSDAQADGFDPEAVAGECSAMTRGLTQRECSAATDAHVPTHGQLMYLKYGITGVRGQVEAGLPAVILHGLPLLEKLLADGRSEDEAGAAALLAIIAHAADTNMIARSDIDTQRREADRAENILNDLLNSKSETASRALLEKLDTDYISRNLSPGGSADLLAVCWMLHFCRRL